MKSRKTWAVIFSIVYFAPFVLGGWYFAFAGLIDSFWGVDNTLVQNVLALLIVTGYGVLYSLVMSLLLKLNIKRIISKTAIIVSSFCLLIMIAQ